MRVITIKVLVWFTCPVLRKRKCIWNFPLKCCELKLEIKGNKRYWSSRVLHVKQDGCRNCFVTALCNEEQTRLVTHRPRGILSFTNFQFFFLRHIFSLIPPLLFFYVSLSFSFIIQFCTLPGLSHFTKHVFSILFFVSLLQIVLSHLSLNFIPLFFSFSRSRRRVLFAKFNPPYPRVPFQPTLLSTNQLSPSLLDKGV